MASPKKLTLLFDGDCRFCRTWIYAWQKRTGQTVEYREYQSNLDRFPQVTKADCQRSVQLIALDGTVSSGARAVFGALAAGGRTRWLRLYQHLPGFAWLSERAYRLIAANRSSMLALTLLAWGPVVQPASYVFSSWLFIKILGAIYLIAFASFGVQAAGLIGSRGILPAAQYLSQVKETLGLSWLWNLPTVLGFNASNGMISALIITGLVTSLLLIAGVFPRLMLVVLFLLYLSLVNGSQDFLSFQWDILLLEVGFLAIWISPRSNLVVWLLWWLLFRLMFLSGAVKLLSGDAVWRNLTALTYHYQTQPLPTMLAWFAHHLPLWWHKLSTIIMFVIELGFPFLIFMPRHFKWVAAGGIALLMTVIFATGNYTFFNLITVALILLLLDDQLWRRLLPSNWADRVIDGTIPNGIGWPSLTSLELSILAPAASALTVILVIGYLSVSLLFMYSALTQRRGPPPVAARAIIASVQPWHVVNNYGLFANLTESRPELIIEGSADGQTWQPYHFKHKPGALTIAPTFVQPHQPRLDWQMWFAALTAERVGVIDQDGSSKIAVDRWLVSLIRQLLEGSRPVTALFKDNPFSDRPPRFIRLQLYTYRFTTPDERATTKNWWHRELIGTYIPPASL